MDSKLIRKMGNSVGLTLNGTLTSAVAGLQVGDEVTLTYEKNKITIRKAVK